ncbi:unnamed protein product [Musa acuminata subsp. malaccensis]|uniref:(wild Malaysian banana) hypothetical protein n=1 Tax=Musa acuminata subsp. malaccensis TaxID=214687 RepID=A0A804KEZ3_MUSAM|nr:unnamed protein product [Musa acuminata subsp. malaccensis]
MVDLHKFFKAATYWRKRLQFPVVLCSLLILLFATGP